MQATIFSMWNKGKDDLSDKVVLSYRVISVKIIVYLFLENRNRKLYMGDLSNSSLSDTLSDQEEDTQNLSLETKIIKLLEILWISGKSGC